MGDSPGWIGGPALSSGSGRRSFLRFDRHRKGPMVEDAVIRRLEVIGEAVKGLPDELRERHSEVPWWIR